jgi:hypothetical protein
VALISNSTRELKAYFTSGSAWSQIYETFHLSVFEWISITSTGNLNITAFSANDSRFYDYFVNVFNLNELHNYASGTFSYFSDFEVIPINKEIPSIFVDWSDGTSKLFQTTNKSGFEFLHYLNTENSDIFIQQLKLSGNIVINGTTLREVEFTQTLISEDYVKLVIRGISEVEQTIFNLVSNNTHSLYLDSTYTYYTDYAARWISETPALETFDNGEGINTATKRITKMVKQLKFYMEETEAFALKNNFEKATTIVFDGATTVKENREVSPTSLGEGIYEVIVNLMINTA